MIQIHPISILAPLAVGVVAQACAIVIYLVPVRTVNLIRREKAWVMSACPGLIWVFLLGQYSRSLAHLVEIALWAVLFIICGEFTDFGTAFYHSAVN